MITPKSISLNLPTQVIRTTSTSSTWAGAGTIVNSGDTLRWAVTGGATVPEVTDNNPVIDLSGNGGTANVTVRNRDRFNGITLLNLSSSNIVTADVTRLINLQTLDLSSNSGLSALNISNCAALINVILSSCSLTDLDISDNDAITLLNVRGNSLTSVEINNIIINLDSFGLENGTLNYSFQSPAADPTSASYNAYNELIGKGWTITGNAPSAP